MKSAADVMSHDLVTLQEEQLNYYAFLRMDEHDMRHIPVVDSDGTLKGIVSDRDLKKKLNNAFDPERECFNDLAFMMQEVQQVMTPDPVFAYPDTKLLVISRMMLTHKISSVVILSPETEKPVGIVTSTDLLEVLNEYLIQEPKQ